MSYGLVTDKPYSVGAAESKRFRPAPWLAEAFFATIDLDLVSTNPAKAVTQGLRRRTTERNDASRHPYPACVVAGMDAIRRNVVDLDAMVRWVSHQERLSTTDRGRRRVLAQKRTIEAVLAQRPGVVPGTALMAYTPAYHPQATGRVSEARGGMQNATRSLKYAAYGSQLRSGLLFNYDLVNAHPRIAAEFAERHGLDLPWLAAYGAAGPDDPRGDIALDLDVPVGLLKDVVICILFGAWPHSALNRVDAEIVAILLRHFEPDQVESVWEGLAGGVMPLAREIRKLTRFMEGPYFEENAGLGQRGRFLRNAAGMLFYPGPNDPPGQIVSHVLQGVEARFVHELAALSSTYAYEVRSNEYDGLVTGAPIPENAIERARAAAGMERLELREKAICSGEEADRGDRALLLPTP